MMRSKTRHHGTSICTTEKKSEAARNKKEENSLESKRTSAVKTKFWWHNLKCTGCRCNTAWDSSDEEDKGNHEAGAWEEDEDDDSKDDENVEGRE